MENHLFWEYTLLPYGTCEIVIDSGFEGSSHFLIACCSTCTFAAIEPVTDATASAIMKIILHFGLCHTCIFEKESNLIGVCWEALDLLQINCNILSSGNHNLMLVERLNHYLNKALLIMTMSRTPIALLWKQLSCLFMLGPSAHAGDRYLPLCGGSWA